jgi:parvulin-like peptidyl-prolyl isomerase
LRLIRSTILPIGLCGFLALAGCTPDDQPPADASSSPLVSLQKPAQPATPPPVEDQTVAIIDGLQITQQQFEQPLIEAYGLDMLLKVVQLELAKQQASRLGIKVTRGDIDGEMQRYLDQVFKDDKQIAHLRDDYDTNTSAGKTADAALDRQQIQEEQQRLLAQLLDNQKLTRTEFNLAIETTTYLRAVVQPAVESKLTDENLQESFRARYGEKVQVRHIACANLQEIAEVKRRLAAGESFAQVAIELSRNRDTGPLGGELQPFTRSTSGLPQVFKDTAFALQKPGDISDPVQADGAYHLIQLMDRIPPTAVKFEDVKQSVREDLAEALTEAAVRDIRNQLAGEAIRNLHINDPVLAQQFKDKLTQKDTQIHDRDLIRQELESERRAAAATEPAHEATAAPAATVPTSRP